MEHDEKIDMYTLIELSIVSAHLEQVSDALLNVSCAMYDEFMDTDLEIIDRMQTYIDNLLEKVNNLGEELLNKNGMGMEDEI